MRFYSFFISVSPLFFIPQFIWSLTNLIFIYVGIHSIDLSGLFYSCFCFCFCCSWSCSCSCYCSSLSVVRYWLFVPAKRVRLWNMHTIHIILHIYIWYKLRYYLYTHLFICPHHCPVNFLSTSYPFQKSIRFIFYFQPYSSISTVVRLYTWYWF